MAYESRSLILKSGQDFVLPVWFVRKGGILVCGFAICRDGNGDLDLCNLTVAREYGFLEW